MFIRICHNIQVDTIYTKNIDTKNGLVNGAQGIVPSIEWDHPEDHIQNKLPRCVNVLFDDSSAFQLLNPNRNEPIGIKPITVSFIGNDHKYVTRTQIPLMLSFPNTIHKICDMGPSIFTGGMVYVALSRVSSLNNPYLLKLCSPRIYP